MGGGIVENGLHICDIICIVVLRMDAMISCYLRGFAGGTFLAFRSLTVLVFVFACMMVSGQRLLAEDGSLHRNRVDRSEIDRSWLEAIRGPDYDRATESTDELQSNNEASAEDLGQPVDSAADSPEADGMNEADDRIRLRSGPDSADSLFADEEGTSPADETAASPPEGGLFPATEGPSFVGTAFRFLLVLFVMVAAFYLIMRFMKQRSWLPGGGDGLIQVIASVPIMPGKFLQVVDMAGKLLVLGVSESGIRLVAEIEDRETVDRIRLWHSKKPASPFPGTLLGRLQETIEKTDLKFWSSAKNDLTAEVGIPPAASATRLNRAERAEAVDGDRSGGGYEPSARPVSDRESTADRLDFRTMLDQQAGHDPAVDDEDDFADMLRRQKERLNRLKRQG